MKARTAVCLLILLASVALAGCGLFVKRIPPGVIPNPTQHDHFVEVGGINYHYTEYPAPGQTIFLLHGFGSSTYSWDDVAPLLQRQGFHVCALDMKGFGWSDKPPGEDYGPLALVASVNAWMDSMNLKEVVFVGNSLGGGIAVLMSIMHPDKVSRMVLVDAGGYPMKMPFVLKIARMPLGGTVADLFYGRWLVRWNLREVFYHDDRVTAARVNAYYDRLRTKNALDAMSSLAKSIDFNTFEDYLEPARQLEMPTLIIWGQNDKWVPLEIGQRFKTDLRDSRLVVIPECGHVPQEEEPGITAKLIADFAREGQLSVAGEALVTGRADD